MVALQDNDIKMSTNRVVDFSDAGNHGGDSITNLCPA